jgi:hypothetical protein
LEDNRAVTDAGWLPPAEDCPALADLREAHERVLAAAAEASKTAADLHRQRNAELEALRAAEEEALFSGKDTKTPDVTVTEDEIAEARVKAEAARDALQRWVRQAIEQVREREGEIVAALEETALAAIAKRVEAQRLLAEADAMERTPQRLQLWLARINGQSKLGHFPYSQLAAPAPPEPLDLEAALAGGDRTEVEVLG